MSRHIVIPGSGQFGTILVRAFRAKFVPPGTKRPAKSAARQMNVEVARAQEAVLDRARFAKTLEPQMEVASAKVLKATLLTLDHKIRAADVVPVLE
jgi:hypothetical protein